MFCPRCGQEQITNETRFCSRCGFLLTGVFGLLTSGGELPTVQQGRTGPDTPRKRGLKQGLFIFLLTFLIVPIITILTVWIGAEPFLVVISSILFSVGGLLRIAYAMLFESNAQIFADGELQHQISDFQRPALSGNQSITAETYFPPRAANWRETNELEPASVVDNTTKLLTKDQ